MAIDLILRWQGVPAPEYARRFRTAAHIVDFSPALREIAKLGVRPAVARNFAEGGRPPWTPLAESTIQNKIRRSLPSRILVATTRLESWATSRSAYRITSHSLETVGGPDYWIHHQTGTPRMPQRVIFNLQIADQRIIGGIFNNFIAAHLAANGLKVRGQHTVVGGGGNTGGL